MRKTRNVRGGPTVHALEGLESRRMMDSAPLPLITDLQNVNNTVVRFETTMGDIDIELFDNAAPITVANFLAYIRRGDYDRTFFHRLDDDFVVQGGLSRIAESGTGFAEIPTQPPITNEFNQSNLQGTIAMARVGGQVNSATSQFFFNLGNNTFLDTVDQGFTVFGKIVGGTTGPSWDVLQDINDMMIPSPALASPYNEVPVNPGFDNGDGVQEDELLVILDAEIIKPANVAAFYTHRYYYPEGFASGSITEFVPMGNPNGTTVFYQAIVRAETRQEQPDRTSNPNDADPTFWFRDIVVDTASVPANSRRGFTVSRSADPADDLVERDVPYGIEIWSTGPLSINLSHYDFGTATGETFASEPGLRWVLPDVRKGTDIFDFVVWQNTSDVDTTVSIQFFFETGNPVTITRDAEAFRRGGLSIADIPALPNGNMSVIITCDEPIVAALTHFDNSGDKQGSTGLGITGDGLARGILPGGNMASGISERLSFVNPGNTAAIITLTFTFDDGSPEFQISPGSLILSSRDRATFDTSTVPQLDGKTYSIRYSSGAALIYASVSHDEFGDGLATPFAHTAATNHDFAEGFMDAARAGDDLFERLSVFNPNFNVFGVPATDAAVNIRLYYTDGFVLDLDFVVAGGERLDVDLDQNAQVLAQATGGRQFFSIEIVSDVPTVASMRHIDNGLGFGNADPSGGFITLGAQRGTVLSLLNLDDF
jgi:peptidyl-prolyl cis-trans isomerase A (cyclophilin A)